MENKFKMLNIFSSKWLYIKYQQNGINASFQVFLTTKMLCDYVLLIVLILEHHDSIFVLSGIHLLYCS